MGHTCPSRRRGLVNRFATSALVGLVLAVLIYAGFVVVMDAETLGATLETLSWRAVGFALLASSGNYVLRFLKWELSLGWLGIRARGVRLSHAHSFVIYLAGLSMSISPGKIGEVLRSALLKRSHGVPATETAPIVVADRLTDLFALVILSAMVLGRERAYVPFLAVVSVVVLAAAFMLGSPRALATCTRTLVRLPRLGPHLEQPLHHLAQASLRLMSIRRVLLLTLLSVLGWGLECVGYWLILRGFDLQPALTLATFLWSAGTLVGALSFLPGGLGATEASLVLATHRLVAGATHPVAAAAAFVARLCTLWFGEVVGALALLVFLRGHARTNRPILDP